MDLTTDLTAMLGRLDQLIADLQDAERRADLTRVHPTHRAGARNLVHYVELRARDLRGLQTGLTAVGATRLSTTEPAVIPRLKAARFVLAALLGHPPTAEQFHEVDSAFATADETLERHADALLGPAELASRIIVTMPAEAADPVEGPELVRGFVESGMQIARINCAHDGPAEWSRMIAHVRAAGDVRIMMDLAGPKLRTGAITPGPRVGRARVLRTEDGQVTAPARIYLTADGAEYPTAVIGRPVLPVAVDRVWLAAIAEGDKVRLRDHRGKKRVFTAVAVDAAGVLLAGNRNAYLAEGGVLEHDFTRTHAHGIPATERRLRLYRDDRLVLTTDPAPVDPDGGRISCSLPEVVRAIKVGERVLFDDGRISAVATDTTGDEVGLRITRAAPGGTTLASYKGINLPDSDLPLPALTDEDLAALEFVARHADLVAISFIHAPDDVTAVLAELDRLGTDIGLVLKIETTTAYERLPEIMVTGMARERFGLMIARGDLAVELGFERLAEVPRLILQLAEAAHVPAIMATQVLENLAKTGLPSRAEITDAAYALRSEAVMLNKGPQIPEAIAVLRRLSEKLGRGQRKNRMLLRQVRSWDRPTAHEE